MKIIIYILLIAISLSCSYNQKEKLDKNETVYSAGIVGTWKLVYGEIRENDSIQIRDISKSDFIKIINKTHFAFFNQRKGDSEGFYGGAGSYSLDGDNYIEKLDYIGNVQMRNHVFPFTIEIKGDSLIQKGIEEVAEINMKRYIMEKYIRVK